MKPAFCRERAPFYYPFPHTAFVGQPCAEAKPVDLKVFYGQVVLHDAMQSLHFVQVRTFPCKKQNYSLVGVGALIGQLMLTYPCMSGDAVFCLSLVVL